MGQFIPFDNNVEVKGEVVITLTKGIENFYRELLFDLLEKNGIKNPKYGHWYKLELLLNTFKDVNKYFGAHMLYKIGKEIPENIFFQRKTRNLKEALNSINKSYKNNHRGGEIGYYKLLNFDKEKKMAYMECKNPYPCHFDRGIITQIATMHKPALSKNIEVFLDPNKKGRLDGKASSWYFIKW